MSPHGTRPTVQNSLPSRALRSVVALCAALLFTVVFAGGAEAAPAAVDTVHGRTTGSWPFATLDVPADRPSGKGIRVAIVDSGVDVAHPAFAGRVAGATDCVGSGGDPKKCTGQPIDDNGHGTHIAGIIAAHGGQGVPEGVAPRAEILAVRALTNTCTGKGRDHECRALGQLGDVVGGVRWATAHHANVINLSIDAGVDLDWKSGDLADAIADAWRSGAVVVASTGNRSVTIDDPNLQTVPLVLVGALTATGSRAPYSNLPGTARWGLMAPGGEAGGACPTDGVLSTYPRRLEAAGTGCLSGTSMAAAYVSGAVASLMSSGVDGPTALSRLLDTAQQTASVGAPIADLSAALSSPTTSPAAELTRGLQIHDRSREASDGAVFSAGLPLHEWTRSHPIRTRLFGTLAILAGVVLMLTHRSRVKAPLPLGY